MNIFCHDVADTCSGDPLLAGQPLLVDKSVSTETGPEKAAGAGTHRERPVPVGTEVVSISGSEVDAGISELLLPAYFPVPNVLALLIDAACVATTPIAETVGQGHVVCPGLHIVGQLLDLGFRLWGDNRGRRRRIWLRRRRRRLALCLERKGNTRQKKQRLAFIPSQVCSDHLRTLVICSPS